MLAPPHLPWVPSIHISKFYCVQDAYIKLNFRGLN